MMAEGNDSSAPRKRRSTGDRGMQYSFNIELPREQENRLLGIKDRIKMAKSALNLTKATSNTQNADLLEALLLALEEKLQRKSEASLSLGSPITSQSSLSMSANSSVSPTPSTPLANIPVATSTPRSRTSLPFFRPDSPMQSSNSPNVETSSTRAPQQFQVSTPAAEDDPIYLCSEGALRSLFSFFSVSLSSECCYCGKPLQPDSLSFNRQSHAVSVKIFCICGDSFKWLSSPIMGGSTPKYYVNMRMIHGTLSSGLTEMQYSSLCQAANIGSEGEKTFDTVLKKLQYMAVVKGVCTESMAAAQEEIKNSPNYIVNGEGNHNKCHAESRCKQEGYVMSKKLVTKPEAVAAYKKAISGTSIYRHASDYMRCRETYWIESFHTAMLICF